MASRPKAVFTHPSALKWERAGSLIIKVTTVSPLRRRRGGHRSRCIDPIPIEMTIPSSSDRADANTDINKQSAKGSSRERLPKYLETVHDTFVECINGKASPENLLMAVVVLRVRVLASATRFSSAALSRLAARRDCHFYGYRTRRCRFCYNNSVSFEVEFPIVQYSHVF
ncbi:hypothetical protein E4U09_007725 [Claviceps aff. purpurea]|uniref:Uncharacterized protein n=1 Tax=Claviceps aff. purpurea TaxID=1967640 RepID=A0A9P7Q9K6_9HYPO|nr:hypothetical protein E4U09_007725 [Claviceps aff. purpurea]